MGECGGMIGGLSNPIKAGLAPAQGVLKAAKLIFIVIAPG
jgi:hypothetical protein